MVIQKRDENLGDLILTVQTIPYDEIDPSRMPENYLSTLPDPAEREYQSFVDAKFNYSIVLLPYICLPASIAFFISHLHF